MSVKRLDVVDAIIAYQRELDSSVLYELTTDPNFTNEQYEILLEVCKAAQKIAWSENYEQELEEFALAESFKVVTSNRGGARVGAGRKAKLDSEKRARVQLYLLPSEKVKVLSYIEKLRARKAP